MRFILSAGVVVACVSTFTIVSVSGAARGEDPASARTSFAPGSGPLEVDLDAQVERRLRALAERRAKRLDALRPFHPVAGAVEYGEAAAQFGAHRGGRSHAGQDVFAADGTPLVAVRNSVVLETGSDGGRGNYVALYDRRSDRTYVYFHMQGSATVKTGEKVTGGQRVGAVGCTGSCFGTHLHFEVRKGRSLQGEPIDPLPLLRDWKRAAA